MRDPRVESLAKILVGYSTAVKAGEIVSIDGENAAEPLLLAVYEEVLKAGAHPILNVALDGQSAAYFKHASDEQLDWISPVSAWTVENVDVRIAVGASTNTRELSAVPPERQTRRQMATGELMARAMDRSADGSFRWCYTLYPTGAYASEAEMSLVDYEDFYFGACLATGDGDPLTAWERASAETVRLAGWIEGHEEVRVIAPGTDITLGIAGRTWINCDGGENMPDGEVFTGPIEDATNGIVAYHFPAVYQGREVGPVRLRFEHGKVVDASAARGEEFLFAMLDQDAGGRILGEAAIGTNYSIDRHTRNTLFDEKIGGTMHIALGASLPESGGRNKSAVHWDMVCDTPRRQDRRRRRGLPGRRQVRRLSLGRRVLSPQGDPPPPAVAKAVCYWLGSGEPARRELSLNGVTRKRAISPPTRYTRGARGACW